MHHTSIIDPGHKYRLLSLDGKHKQTLQFVKRKGKGYPGNDSAYPGTTLQDVFQCCLNRVRYLQNQIPCVENEVIIKNLQESLLLLEQRAATRHGIDFEVASLEELEFAGLCLTCGHTQCSCEAF